MYKIFTPLVYRGNFRIPANFVHSLVMFLLFISSSLLSCKQQQEEPETGIRTLSNRSVDHQLNTLIAPIQLLTDQNFQKGFNVLHPGTGAIQGPLQYTTANGSPVWKLAQWYSQSSIYGASPSTLASGSSHFANSYKAITIGPTTSTDGSLIFAMNGQNEFNNVYRTASNPFPHLLADLKIADPDGWLGTTTPFIGSLSSVQFNIDAKLLYHARNQKIGYNSAIHAVQFSCTFLIQNLNPASTGYGKAMYFLVMLFDDRYPVPPQAISADVFNGQLIYNVGITPFSSTGLSVGQWKNINGNLLPLIKNGLTEAWSRGILTQSQNYNDYKISLFTMGIECPGLNILTMQVKNLSLIAN
ncbi:hypothetical protein SAMN04487898_11075 [Pedobacter sp. ok626]|uniref:hypothetical protein n=1 Tax=Pedobacter sp. ok626 TaxID=1761882 RepID=UPI00088AD1B5|nr:hypothetical protein [Pedobacter sp. ok626]SDK64871.1 hypothetical protein SAMN04487898_11075 [Pedobacter sp. ok626]